MRLALGLIITQLVEEIVSVITDGERHIPALIVLAAVAGMGCNVSLAVFAAAKLDHVRSIPAPLIVKGHWAVLAL